MLTLRRIEIDNFVFFNDLTLELSHCGEQPLTVIRAENGNGKTTLLRAIRWGMYGEEGLPSPSARYSVHPPWWHPADPAIKTRVSIEFETDGSSRNHAGTGSQPLLYRLDRVVTTIGKPDAKKDTPDYHRVDGRVTLMVRDLSGNWVSHEKHPNVVVKELLPWDLRDFFVMDADEAADFVGGSDEYKTVSRHDYQEKTSYAINSLLGLDVFKKAKSRVDNIANTFSKKATRAIGDHDLDELQERLDRARVDKMELEELIQQERDREAALADRLDELQSELEGELGRLGAYEALSAQLKHNKERRKLEARYRVDCIVTLAGNLESADLRGMLAYSATSQMLKFLQPLYKRGQIPLAHLPFVRGLLDAGLCVCGQDLTEGTYGHRVAGRVAEAEHEADRADYLYHLYQAALALSGVAGDVAWNEKRTGHSAELAACEQRLTELRTEARALNQKLSEIDEVRIQTIRDENAAVRKQLDTSAYRLRRYKDDLHELSEQIVSLDRTIAQRQRNARQAADHRAAEQMARHVVDILDNAYSRIQDRQVADLSGKMNSLFHQMAANVALRK